MIRIFLDANVYFTGFYSKEGGSALLLEIIRRKNKKISLYASKLVLREAERNLRKKGTGAYLKSFHRYLQQTKIHITPAPPEDMLQSYTTVIHPKDLPVLGSALLSKADYLITLDRRHFFTAHLLSKMKKPKILTPGDFVRSVYLKGRL